MAGLVKSHRNGPKITEAMVENLPAPRLAVKKMKTCQKFDG